MTTRGQAAALFPTDHRSDLMIYIFGTSTGTEAKIGKTTKKVSHRKNIQEKANGHHEPLEFLAAVRAAQDSDERTIHNHFRAYRSRPHSKEWFHAPPGSPVRRWIRALQGQSWTAQSIEQADHPMTLEAVHPRNWLPTAMPELAETQMMLELGIDLANPWGDVKQPDEMMDGDFYTHPMLTAAIREFYGGAIDVDPASCRAANMKVRARTFFGAKEDGLTKEWNGRVWLNPPFGRWDNWAAKAVSEHESGRATELCALASTRSLTAHSIHPLVARADAIWIGKGRFAFWGPNATSSPDDGHVIFYLGPNVEGFSEALNGVGVVFRRSQS